MKHQADCYRMIKGRKYINRGDIIGPDDEAAVFACKANKIPHRVIRHRDGFRQLFVREDQAQKLI